ncbi:MAG TPA: hypothetical protein DCX22_03245 [Dehalococcoidia bacterium]|nr:hypothetical protein [Dehalococcoidia bacterium]
MKQPLVNLTKMSDNKNKVEKLLGPSAIPGLVQKYLMEEKKLAPNLAQLLKAVVKKDTGNGYKKAFHIRIFDEDDAVARKIHIKDYTSLDEHAAMIIYDGWYDEIEKKVKLEQKKDAGQDTPILTFQQIQSGIEALSQPGSTYTVFMARGPANGGPLGRGCAVVELTPPVAGKKVKKYTIYTADVVDNQPVNKGSKVFDSDKAKDVAVWIKNGHQERMY